jgi:hypothetical protein
MKTEWFDFIWKDMSDEFGVKVRSHPNMLKTGT